MILSQRYSLFYDSRINKKFEFEYDYWILKLEFVFWENAIKGVTVANRGPSTLYGSTWLDGNNKAFKDILSVRSKRLKYSQSVASADKQAAT